MMINQAVITLSQDCSLNQIKGDDFVPHYFALVQSNLKYCAQFWVPQYKEDTRLLESVQKEGYKDGEGSGEEAM